MKIFLSPAKRLNESSNEKWDLISKPRFSEQSEILMNVLKQKSPKDLSELMKISNNLAELNYDKNQEWERNPKEEKTFHAGLMFDGEVYRGLRNLDLNPKSLKYLQENMFILSGLYGILSITDLVLPYRLEMGTKLKVNKLNDLYEFWTDTVTDFVNSVTKKDEILLDLSSKEYMKVLDKDKLKGRIIDVKFKDYKDGKLKQITVYFKKARGEMANYCAENQVTTLEEIKQFDKMGYALDSKLSTEKTLVYTR